MEIIIKPLTVALIADYFDFLDNRAFTDNSPWGGCYCTGWQMTKEEEKTQLLDQMEEGFVYGDKNFIRVLREIVERQIASKALQGYLAYVDGVQSAGAMQTIKQVFLLNLQTDFIYTPLPKNEKKPCFALKSPQNIAEKALPLLY